MAELYPLSHVISPVSPNGGAPARVERDSQRAAPPPPPAQAAPASASSGATEYRGNNLNIEA
ncbi:MAG: hypothetical protein HY059_02135 [Proteobacteria bacterium]|nr:hypothetical protein [Pseudomonadota bacterium]